MDKWSSMYGWRQNYQRFIEDPLADFVLGRQLEPGSTILVARKGDEEVDITVVPPAPPEAIAVASAPDAPPQDIADITE